MHIVANQSPLIVACVLCNKHTLLGSMHIVYTKQSLLIVACNPWLRRNCLKILREDMIFQIDVWLFKNVYQRKNSF
jgi:hypothetical protein